MCLLIHHSKVMPHNLWRKHLLHIHTGKYYAPSVFLVLVFI